MHSHVISLCRTEAIEERNCLKLVMERGGGISGFDYKKTGEQRMNQSNYHKIWLYFARTQIILSTSCIHTCRTTCIRTIQVFLIIVSIP